MPIHTFDIVYETTGYVSVEVTAEQAEVIRGHYDNPAFLAAVELVVERGQIVAVVINGERHAVLRASEHCEVTTVSYEPRSEAQRRLA